MDMLKLPQPAKPFDATCLQGVRQLTLLGANGAGKSRFMEEMISLNADRAMPLSALGAFYSEPAESVLPGSMDSRYREAVRSNSFMRADAASELDKVLYLLYSDELGELLEGKHHRGKNKRKGSHRPSRLDKVKRIWEEIFPGNRMEVDLTGIRFSTSSGPDMIATCSLSQGERAALYYIGAVMLAPRNGVVFVDSPTLFIHQSVLGPIWNRIEQSRPDCILVYDSIDEEFVMTRTHNASLWVKSYDSSARAWDYSPLEAGRLPESVRRSLAGERRRVLFIEGDSVHSLDIRLYSLLFPEMSIRPLGSCNKVIETVRSLNDQSQIHMLKSQGIVDRDRRTDREVEYLRAKDVMVPDVAEIENIFLLPEVIKVMARTRGRNAAKVLRHVTREVLREFRHHCDRQALEHVRHHVKRELECKADARFPCITAMELHLAKLGEKLQPRRRYDALRQEFLALLAEENYLGVLKVFNHKPMLGDCGPHPLLGFRTKEEYTGAVLDTLKSASPEGRAMAVAIRKCLHFHEETPSHENKTATGLNYKTGHEDIK